MKDELGHATLLRKQAEKRLASKKPALPVDEAEQGRLIHELQVHQVELELQNEMLTETLARVNSLRAKYNDLYDFAPVGYFTLTRDGRISEVNRRGAVLLGDSAARLVGQPLRAFFEAESLAALDQLLCAAADSGDDVFAQCLHVRHKRPMPLYVNAQAHAFVEPGSHETLLRLVLMDVSALKMARDDVVQVIANAAGFSLH